MLLHWFQAEAPQGCEISGTVGMPDQPSGLTPSIPVVGEVTVCLHAVANRRECECSGEMTTNVDYLCARCLCEIHKRLEIPFHEVLVRGTLSEAEIQADVIQVTEDEIDLDPYVRQAVYLAIPFTAVCKEDCLGLCPQCGRDRNLDPCDCQVDVLDPRLEALAAFLVKNDEAE